MSIPDHIDGLGALAGRYDALLCDAWGVIHNGVELFSGVSEAMARFRQECGPIVILTNAPRPSSIIPAQLDRLGLARAAYDAVVSSGDATRAEIVRRLPSPAYHIGPEYDDPLFDGLEIDFVPLREAQFLICTGLSHDNHEEPEDFRGLLAEAAARDLPMICANPDIVVNYGGRIVWCAGALAEIYAGLGGAVVYGGKPHAPIYRLALSEIERGRGAPVRRERVLAIGDGLTTDIKGANAEGFDAIFVTGKGGIHDSGAEPGALAERLSETGARPMAMMEALRW